MLHGYQGLLFLLIYYLGAELYLILRKMELTPPVAILISILGIIFGWVAYDIACKSPLGKSNFILSIFFIFLFTLLS